MRKYVLCMLFLLLLTACQSAPQQAERPTPEPTPTPAATGTPTPEPTSEPTAVGIEVDVGDGEHKFWVEAIDTGKPSYDGTVALIRIYRDREDVEPFQTFEETLYMGPLEVAPVDVDFDGDTDISVLLHSYRSIRQRAYYIWDEAQKKFVEDPYGLNDLNNTHFDEERQVVRANWGSVTGETVEYYQYRRGSLVCIRSLYRQYWSEDNTMHLKVEDEVDGVLTTVYEEKIPFGELPEGELWTEEFQRWHDLDYPGE